MDNCDQLIAAIQAQIDATGSITAQEIWALAGSGIGCAVQAIERLANGGFRVTTNTDEIVIEDDPGTTDTASSNASAGTIFGLRPVEAAIVGLLGFAVLGRSR